MMPNIFNTEMAVRNVPDYNYYVEDKVLYYELNVAGYKREDLEVFFDGKFLVAQTKKDYTTDALKKLYDYYVYRVRLLPFSWKTLVHDYYVNSKVSCDLEDGLLKISFRKERSEPQVVNLLS